MPEKYHITVSDAPPRFAPIGKYATVEFREDCAGSCRECVKKNCVYGIFEDGYAHMRDMDEPEYLYTCNSCFRCVQECTKGIFSRVINPEYRSLGDAYWTSDIIHSTWYQAHTGNIPVSGAGYRGPFVGKGFDSMWTDMSEIVRPTRDGIHGREYISTAIELSRRPERLLFKEDMTLATDPPPILEIPLPILFQQPGFGVLSKNVLLSAAEAARRIGTFLLLDPEEITADFAPYMANIIPRVTRENYRDLADLVSACRMVEIAYCRGIEKAFSGLRSANQDLLISVGLPLNADAASIATELAHTQADTIHLYADDHGNERDTDQPRFLGDAIREVHMSLVGESIRHKVNLVLTGGIAMAEHVNKSIICGLDGVVVDTPLLIAMECRVCHRCTHAQPCPVKLETIDPEYGSNRIVNLIGSWRNQMLEMLGAMGLREVRRLRGEVGRSMWFEDLEKENFAPIFGDRKA